MDALYPIFSLRDREASHKYFGPFEVHDPGLDGMQDSLFDPGLGLAAKAHMRSGPAHREINSIFSRNLNGLLMHVLFRGLFILLHPPLFSNSDKSIYEPANPPILRFSTILNPDTSPKRSALRTVTNFAFLLPLSLPLNLSRPEVDDHVSSMACSIIDPS